VLLLPMTEELHAILSAWIADNPARPYDPLLRRANGTPIGRDTLERGARSWGAAAKVEKCHPPLPALAGDGASSEGREDRSGAAHPRARQHPHHDGLHTPLRRGDDSGTQDSASLHNPRYFAELDFPSSNVS